MDSAVFDKIVGDILRSPGQFRQTRVDLLVQELYSLFKQAKTSELANAAVDHYDRQLKPDNHQ